MFVKTNRESLRTRRGAGKGGYSLSQKRISPFKSPKRKVLDWQSQSRMTFLPPEWKCLRAALPRLELLHDLPLLLLSAVAQPLAALPPYGCGVPLAGNERPAGWQYLRHKFIGAMPSSLSLRGGRRPTWQSREGSYVFADGFPVIRHCPARFPRRFAPRNDKSEVRAILAMA